MKNIMIQNIEVKDLVALIEGVIKPLLISEDDVRSNKPQLQLLTRKQTADMLHVSLMTLHKWNKIGVLKAYGMGNRVLYKLEDIEQALKRVA